MRFVVAVAAFGVLEEVGLGDLSRNRVRVRRGDTSSTRCRQCRLYQPILCCEKDALELCIVWPNVPHQRVRRQDGCCAGEAGGRYRANADRRLPWHVVAERRWQMKWNAAGAAGRGSVARHRNLHGRTLVDCSRGSPSLRSDGGRCDRPSSRATWLEKCPRGKTTPLASDNRLTKRTREERDDGGCTTCLCVDTEVQHRAEGTVRGLKVGSARREQTANFARHASC